VSPPSHAEVGDKVSITFGQGKSSLIHEVVCPESPFLGATACRLRIKTVQRVGELNDMLVDPHTPVTCMWCAAGLPYENEK
jgi:hypothetical protein